MKKVMMTLFMATLTPIMNSHVNGIGNCFAEDDFPKMPHVPDVAPVYSSYYDEADNKLYIYGTEEMTTIEVKVIYEGMTVLYEAIPPEDLPAVYDFNDSKGGAYQVVISAGNTILTSFTFYRN